MEPVMCSRCRRPSPRTSRERVTCRSLRGGGCGTAHPSLGAAACCLWRHARQRPNDARGVVYLDETPLTEEDQELLDVACGRQCLNCRRELRRMRACLRRARRRLRPMGPRNGRHGRVSVGTVTRFRSARGA